MVANTIGHGIKPDAAALGDFWDHHTIPGCVYEVRALTGGRRRYGRVASGYFNRRDCFITALLPVTGLDVVGVYITLNPVNPALLARAKNKLVNNAEKTTDDSDVRALRRFLIDIDPVRPAGISATDDEQAKALMRRGEIRDFLHDVLNWGDPVAVTSSGNGAGLLYAIDMPNDSAHADMLRGALVALAALFSDNDVSVDTSNHNAGRITRVVGSIAAKGDDLAAEDDMPARPWRVASALYPDALQITEEQIAALAALVPAKEETRRQDVSAGDRTRPGDDYIARATWQDVIGPVGWAFTRKKGEISYWGRPGKDGEISGSTNYAGNDLLHVWTSSASPFQPNKSYNKFMAYALLHHNGDSSAAASELRKRGYGQDAATGATNQHTTQQEEHVSAGTSDSGDGAQSAAPPNTNGGEASDGDDVHLTDLGNAQRFAQQRGGYNRYCYEWGQWLTYDQGRWRSDRPDLVMAAAKDTVRSIYGEAKDEIDDKKRKAIADWAKRSESHQRITAMLALAQSELPLPLAQLNADPWLLNCANGTVNLRTGLLQRHRPEDWLTHQAPVAYNQGAACPVWMAFLTRIFAGSNDLTSFVQRGLGYTITASVREQCMFFLYGTGSNGKSTLLGTIQEILGRDYSMQATSEFLLDKKGGSDHPTERADLFQKRFVSTIEVENGRRMAEALMKQLTGGDRIRARRMRENFWEFDPTHKIFLAANHKPTIKGNDHGVWRRIHLVPFDVTIPDSEKDMALGDKLRTEMPGILAWLVQGCIAWQRQGLAPPKKVRDATAEYRAEMDVLAAFLADRCVINDKAHVTAKDLYTAYCAWCDDNGERKDSAKAFGVQLDERGFAAGKSGNERFRRGLALIPPPAPPTSDDPYPPSDTDTAFPGDAAQNGTHASHGTRFNPISGIANTKLSHEADIGKNVSHTSQTCPKDRPAADGESDEDEGDLVPDAYEEAVI